MKTKFMKYLVTGTVAIFLALTIGGCEDEDIGMVGICPEVESTNPTNAQTGVPFNQVITVTFKEAVDPVTINGATILINGPGGLISGNISYTGRVATFVPNVPLLPNTTYTGTVTMGVKDVLGNAMLQPYVWTFTTGLLPTVISTDPVNNATGVPINKVITATFSAMMNPQSITTASFLVNSGFQTIAGVVTYSGFTASFTPSSPLTPNTTYTGTITTNVRNVAGASLASNYVWSFTTDNSPTVIVTDPLNNATGVSLSKVITASFSVPMNPATLSTASFTLMNGTTPVAGLVTYSGTTATFTPTSQLLPNTTYTATITAAARNLAGTPLSAPYVWKFSTMAAPTVLSTNPTNNQTGVLPGSAISVLFSEAMLPSSLTSTSFTINNGTQNITGVLSYSGNTLTFTPSSPLVAGTTYSGRVTTDAKSLAGVSMANNYNWTFSTASLPFVVSTIPLNNASDVPLNTVIRVTFNVPMSPSTFTSSTFVVKSGANTIGGSITYAGNTASFTPTSLLSANTSYTVTVTTGVKDLAGLGIANDYVFNFNTIVIPTVISTSPVNNAVNVDVDANVSALFSVPMNAATLNSSTFTLRDGSNAVAGIITYSNNTVVFNPTVNLLHGTTYTATLSSAITNTLGTHLAANYVWTFTTKSALTPSIISTDPANNAINVALNKTITATFNQPMDPATFTTTRFTLMQGTNSVVGTVSFNGVTASFNPFVDLTPGTVYTATITTGVRNPEGVALPANYVWSFTTLPDVAPRVISTDPTNNQNNVALNKTLTAVFSMPMNSETINTNSFTLHRGLIAIQGVVEYDALTSTASFNPNNDLVPGIYTATITTHVRNEFGTSMLSNYVWTFSTIPDIAPTVILTDPLNNATNVPLGKTLSATFSTTMDPATINTASFVLRAGSVVIPSVISYSGNIATLNPVADLLPGTTYTATITTAVKNTNGTAMAANYVWSFSTPAANPPLVISTDPLNNATGVALNKNPTATFNMPMDPLTINNVSYTLKNGSTNVVGTVSYSGNTAIFSPSVNLLPGTTYTATISTAVKNTQGTPMANNYVWTFTTELIAPNNPFILFTDPANLAVNVALDKNISATFNMAMDPTSINNLTFTLSNGSVPVPGVVTLNGNTATLNPTSDLILGTTYTATVTTGVKNLAGNGMVSNYVWTFTTVAPVRPLIVSTDPISNATNVALDKTISGTFNMTMDPSTISTGTFVLELGGNEISGVVTYNGLTASFNPVMDLLPNTTYKATITTGAKNLAGVSMLTNYVWSFTTGAGVPPVVTATDPLNNATNVPLDKTLSATFSTVMDPLSFNGTTFTLKAGTTSIVGVINVIGNTATFNPNADLAPNTTYTATITNGVKSLNGTAMLANYVWTFSTGSFVAPTVISTSPQNLETGVLLNKTLSATFSTTMDPSTINGTTFTLQNGSLTVFGNVAYSGNTATFDPIADLLPFTTYTATITTGVKNLAGTNMAVNYVWTFTTQAGAAPTVTSTDPANSSTNIPVNKTLSANFSMLMDPATISGSTFTLYQGLTQISGVVLYSGSTATFKSDVNLLPNTVYTATITTGAKNLAGTPLASNYVWSFTTAALIPPTVTSTDPLNNATGVALNKVLKANFSVLMDPSTINNLTFTLKIGTNTVAGLVTYDGLTASFAPTGGLVSGTTYTATITTGAKNLAGTPLASNYVWTFSTLAPAGPSGIDLKSAADFGILAYTGISNNAGPSVINNMNVGIYPGVRSSITGFPPGVVVNGAIYASDDVEPPGIATILNQAKLDLTAAYLAAEGASAPAPATVSGDLGGTTLAPGIYKTTSTLAVASGNLTLDAGGDANAKWIFQIASTLTTVGGAGGSIVLAGGAKAENITWQVGSSATIGDFTTFYGNVLAYTSITMNSGAVATGRMLALNGAVVLTSSNTINKP